MANLKIKLTVSHNEVNENFSVMARPSTLSVELSEERTTKYNEIRQSFPDILYVWAQQIWDFKFPSTFGKVIKVDVLN